MQLPFASAPKNICILRLSAVGDICHTLPVVRTIQQVWPSTRLTWIIGKLEASLIGDIPDIKFIEFDKSKGFRAYFDLHKKLSGQRFDALLHMQMSLRSSIVNRLVHTKIRIGFDRDRAKDLQWVFNNTAIPSNRNQHVLDSFFGFAEALGIQEKLLQWDIPISDETKATAQKLLSSDKPYLVISPCSTMSYRNWYAQGYAAICDYAAKTHDLNIVLTGGPRQIEQQIGNAISKQSHTPITNLIGKTNLKQLLAILKNAVGVVSPDSGPAHMATAVNTPVIGLYACTNPGRARPYLSEKYVVNRYPEAIEEKFAKSVADVTWGTRVRDPGTMERITIDDVIQKLDLLMRDIAS